MSRIQWNLIIATALLANSMAACGGDSKSAGTPQDFFDSFKESACDYEVKCGLMPDLETCQAVTFFSKEQVTAIAYVDAGKVVYDADKAGACLDFFDGLSCDLDFFAVEADFAAKCGVVLTGPVATGGACTIPEECSAGSSCNYTSSCDTDTQCCSGTCAAPAATTEVALGGDCTQNPRCVAGAYCKSDGTSGVCTAQATTENAPCDAFDACASPLVCNIGLTGGPGTCYKRAANGATCDPSVLLGPCASGLDYCDSTALVCKTRGKPGADCNADDAGSCAEYADCVDAKCAAKPLAGGACTGDASSSNCLGDLVCGTDTKCAAPAAATACP